MSKYIDSDKLRAEIERRRNILKPHGGQGIVVTEILRDHYADLLSFIESLEQSIDADKMIGLDEAAADYAKRGYSTNAEPFDEIRDYQLEKDAFKAGVKWRNTQIPKLPDNLQGLDEAAAAYDESESWRWEAPSYPRREAFKAGAEWMAGQGVGVLYETTISADKTIPALPMTDVSNLGLDYGDKVIVQIRKK